VHKKMLAVVIRRQPDEQAEYEKRISARPAPRSSIWRLGCGRKARVRW